MPVREHDWVSAHVFYHDDLDPLLTGAVAPTVAELARDGLSDTYFFLRYWDGGHHVRLRIAAHLRHHAEIRRRVIDRCAEFMRRRPAPDDLRPEEYAVHAARLARWEGVTDYARRPYLNNSVVFLPYRREHQRYGHGAAMAAVERHFAESSRIALRLLATDPSPGARDTAGYSLLLLSWFCAEPDPAHAQRPATRQARAMTDPDPGSGFGAPLVDRSAVEDSFRRQRASLLELTVRLHRVAAESAEGPASGILRAWVRSINRLRSALAAASRPPGPAIDICAHLVCNRLGISPVGEGVLRHLAARSLAELAHPVDGQKSSRYPRSSSSDA
jgi:thiopeptide-type bacteriocin biosynthesis protein